MLPKPVRDAARKIGAFYLQKHNGDYKAAEKELVQLQITKLEINENQLCITTARVGLLIGRQGQNFNALCNYIDKELQMKVKIKEDMDCLCDCLIPQNEEDFTTWDTE